MPTCAARARVNPGISSRSARVASCERYCAWRLDRPGWPKCGCVASEPPVIRTKFRARWDSNPRPDLDNAPYPPGTPVTRAGYHRSHFLQRARPQRQRPVGGLTSSKLPLSVTGHLEAPRALRP